MDVDTKLSIELRVHPGLNHDGHEVSILSNRPLTAAQLFHGKSAEQVIQLIPNIFTICNKAQACASLRAFEKALGIQVPVIVEKMRDAVVSMETIREQLWRIYLEWPSLVGQAPEKDNLAKILALQREFEQAACCQNLFQLGATSHRFDIETLHNVSEQLVIVLEQSIFAQPIFTWLHMLDYGRFQAWLNSGETVSCRLLARVIANGWADAGHGPFRPIPRFTHEQENQLARAMRDPNFIARPQWQGQCCESTSLTRVDSPMLMTLKKHYGNGLLTRLVARLTEIAMLTQQLVPHKVPEPSKPRVLPVRCDAIGTASAARGHLYHRVALCGTHVSEYQILAPTEWHFHPQGVVSQGLSRLQGSHDSIAQQAQLLINVIDPCIGYEFSLHPDPQQNQVSRINHA